MFIGREKELKILKDNYDYNGFKMVVLYGRRRVGKSFLLQHFLQSLNTDIIAFQAIENSSKLSIEAFKDAILDVFPENYNVQLDSWKSCFNYLNSKVTNRKLVICIDEINYIFKSDNTFASQLQNEIDNNLKNKNVLLIVCGSNISSIENEILNVNSPLYGRRNLSIKLQEFNYKDASRFYSNYSSEEKIIAYSVFGGKGKYLASIDPNVSIKENIIKQILTPGGTLADEIDLLLKDDFRDPTFYKEMLNIISLGNTTFNDICTKLNEDSSKVATYLSKLVDLKMVKKVNTLQKKKAKDYRYYIEDNFFNFYFRFVYKRKNILNILVNPETFYEKFISDNLLSYVGLQFEKICEQYLIEKSLNNELGFIPLEYGKYFGKHKDGSTFDIDVMFKNNEEAICGECKFTNSLFGNNDLNELLNNGKELGLMKIHYYLFLKSGIEKKTNIKSDVNVITIDDLYS
ncbi:MAG: ATP-binding protein [Erysipelotrichaceae bacterium]|nr:ATP-binding protein [Erysipelotrichaceae bacterium]